mmetsp:Transcript_13327/g.34611  ORF Transcript_13327/g.34611 Transcript_13327/m.34611 type:complete len:260 (+) Transcript_13327:471-1250(+)
MRLGLGLLVITQDGHLPVGVVVELHQLILSVLVLLRHVELAQLLLQRVRGVVRTEHLRREVLHELFEVLVQQWWRDLVKQVFGRLLVLHECYDILVDQVGHLNCVLVPDGILTQEIEVDDIRGLTRDVLHSQGATTDSISLFLCVLLSTNSESQFVDEVNRRSLLAVHQVAAFLQLLIAVADLVDDLQQTPCSVVLEQVGLTFDATRGGEAHVLCLAQEAVVKGSDPLHRVLVNNVSPRMTRHTEDLGHRGVGGDVEGA